MSKQAQNYESPKQDILIGADGELLTPAAVEPVGAAALPRKTFLIALLIGVLFLGGGITFLSGTSSTAAPQPTSINPYMPAEIQRNAVYVPGLRYSLNNKADAPPCARRRIRGQIPGSRPGTTIHVWNASKNIDVQTTTDGQGNFVLTIPSQPVDPLNLEVYDAQRQVLSGLANLQFGDNTILLVCSLQIEFTK